MSSSLNVFKLAREVEAESGLCDELLQAGNDLYSPHPSRDGGLLKKTLAGQEIGVLKNGHFVAFDNNNKQD